MGGTSPSPAAGQRSGPLRRALWLALGALVSLPPPSVSQESAACRQARNIVADVRQVYAASPVDHAAVLTRLATARDLCPSLGEAWKYSSCSAKALGQEQKARMYADRAVLNGVKDLSCASSDGTAPPPPKLGPIRDKHALIVGIGTFRDTRIPKLHYTAKDAQNLHDFLVDPQGGRFSEENVHLLIDAAATRQGILTRIQTIFERAREDDLLLVYVSSHGSPRQDAEGLKGIGYIITYDTDFDRMFVDALEFQDFSAKLSLIKARRKVTFLDTCYSGQALRPGAKTLSIGPMGIDQEAARLFTSAEGSYLITSSDEAEQSWESERLQNSFFTFYLLEALRQKGDPPTLKQVYDELARKVSQAVAREKGARQTPQLHPANSPGDLRIGAAPLAPRDAAPSSTPSRSGGDR